MNEIALAQQRERERLRWRVLKIAYAGLSLGVGEHLLHSILADTGHNVSPLHLRDQLVYLEGKGLITVLREHSDWRVKVTPVGTDVAEGVATCPPGLMPED